MPKTVGKASEGQTGIAWECLTWVFLRSFVGKKMMMSWVASEILSSLLCIISASLTLVFAILGKSCIVFSNNLINVLPKCDLNPPKVESVVRKSSVFVWSFIVLWEQKLGTWAWTEGRVGSLESVLGWDGAQPGQEGNVEGRGTNRAEGIGSWNNAAGKFPSSLSPKILWNTGVFSLPRILCWLCAAGACRGYPILAGIFWGAAGGRGPRGLWMSHQWEHSSLTCCRCSLPLFHAGQSLMEEQDLVGEHWNAHLTCAHVAFIILMGWCRIMQSLVPAGPSLGV